MVAIPTHRMTVDPGALEWIALRPVSRYQRHRDHAYRCTNLVRPLHIPFPIVIWLTSLTRFMNREASTVSTQFRYTKVLVLIIESAMIYSAALVVEITLYFIGSNAFYIVYDPIAQLTVRSLLDFLLASQHFLISTGRVSYPR